MKGVYGFDGYVVNSPAIAARNGCSTLKSRCGGSGSLGATVIREEVAHRPDAIGVYRRPVRQLQHPGNLHRARRRGVATRHVVKVEVLREVGKPKAKRRRRPA